MAGEIIKTNKKATISPLVVEIIIGAIAVAFASFIFGGFALPFIEFMADDGNIKSFNKIMTGMSEGCKEGAYTVPYTGLSAHNNRKIYAIALTHTSTANAIIGLKTCNSTTTTTCTDSNSKERIRPCVTNVCYCLYKIKFVRVDNSEDIISNEQSEFCANPDLDAITIPNETVIHDLWDLTLSNTFLVAPNPVEQVKVLQCKQLVETSCMNADKSAMLPKIDGRPIVWLQPDVTTVTVGLAKYSFAKKLWLDSISFERPLTSTGAFGNVSVSSNPNLEVYQYNATTESNPITSTDVKCYKNQILWVTLT